MNLEIIALLETSENAQFLEARQGLLLGIIEVVDNAGSALAHPVSFIRFSESSPVQSLEAAQAVPVSPPKAS